MLENEIPIDAGRCEESSGDTPADTAGFVESMLDAIRRVHSDAEHDPDLTRSHARMDRFRQTGDVLVDKLVREVLPGDDGKREGRLGYNDMLLLADQIMKTPELVFVDDSRLARQLSQKPEHLINYFDPMPAPDWVDEEKLRMGSRVWEENTLLVLGVLYAGSLPACYLVRNGIPALYQSEKLRDAKYIHQRIYETGRMLADCMDPGGLRLVEDSEYDEDRLLIAALRNLDREAEWTQSGRCFLRDGGNPTVEVQPAEVNEEIDRLRGRPQRYLWGKGYLSAKKVRFLHASMRYMLTSPADFRPFGNPQAPASMPEALSQRGQAWDAEKLGVPVNQEDLAYTLLTFGYLIPRGLAEWGVPLTREQKEAFLHLWKVVGHVMGVDDELLTDDWDKAEKLFGFIQKRQAGQSSEGTVLTEALMQFFADYLPHIPAFADRVSTVLVIKQIGRKYAEMIIPAETIGAAMTWWRRPFYSATGRLAQCFFRLRGGFFHRFRFLGGITASCVHEASIQLIESWRGAYLRKPFFVPVNSTTWIRRPGVDEKHLARLRVWRRRLFSALGICLLFLVTAMTALVVSLPAGIFSGQTALTVSLVLAGGCWMTSVVLMNVWMPVIFRERPVIRE